MKSNMTFIPAFLLANGILSIFSSIMYIFTTNNDERWFFRLFVGIVSLGLFQIIQSLENNKKG